MKIIGHRGGTADQTQQNTLKIIDQAIKDHVEAVEIDVRVSSDMVPLLNHDTHVAYEGQQLLIRTTTFQQLRDLKSDLTSLSDVLESAQGKLKLLIEIKPVEPVNPIVKELKRALANGWSAADIEICSFDFQVLKDIHHALPQLAVAVSEPWSGVRAGHRAKILNTKRLIMNQRWLWVGYVRPLANRGYDLTAYTVNNPKRAYKLARIGVGSIVTDYPTKF